MVKNTANAKITLVLRTQLIMKEKVYIGPDKMPNMVLKEFADVLAPSLTAFINFALQNGLRPTQ